VEHQLVDDDGPHERRGVWRAPGVGERHGHEVGAAGRLRELSEADARVGGVEADGFAVAAKRPSRIAGAEGHFTTGATDVEAEGRLVEHDVPAGRQDRAGRDAESLQVNVVVGEVPTPDVEVAAGGVAHLDEVAAGRARLRVMDSTSFTTTAPGLGLLSPAPGVPPRGPLAFQLDFRFHAAGAAAGSTTVRE
jgi:hypothetical protein